MINKLFITVLLLFAFLSANALELKSGDVLLISFNCYECRVIESETESKFSHSGIVLINELNEIRIGQSLGFVALYPLSEFLKNKTPGSAVSVYRTKELFNLKQADQIEIERRMLETFNADFKGLPFDGRYLWDNFDSKGRELLYCSEFVAKFIDRFLNYPTIPYPLTYKKNEQYWLQYFKGKIPEGVLGNSPASFSNDERFIFMGNL